MTNKLKNSVALFDSALDGYFNSCRNYRSKIRKGTVLVVDDNSEIANFLRFLVEHCHLSINVEQMSKASKASDIRKCIDRMGAENVKAIIMDSHVWRVTATAEWMDKNFPNIPIFISNCDPESEPAIKTTACRAGIMTTLHPLVDYVDALGLPDECHDVAIRYSC